MIIAEKSLSVNLLALLTGLVLAFQVGAAELDWSTPEAEGIDPERLARVNQLVERYVDEERVVGMLTLISRNGKLVQSSLKGNMGADNNQPLRHDSLFRIFSMTKAITAVAALILYEEGLFHLDDPVEKFLPDFKDMTVYEDGERRPATIKITMHHLFTHMSGLSYGYRGDHPLAVEQQNLKLDQSETIDEFIKRLAQLPLAYEPGSSWGYSYATDVLGAVVEKLSGQRLGDFMAERIFVPLDMKDTSFSVGEDKLSRLTSLHAWNGQEKKLVLAAGIPFKPGYRVTPFDAGGGGLISTARDYMRFLEMLRSLGKFNELQILSPKTIKFMTKDHLPRRITDANIGPDHDRNLGIGGGHGLGIGVYIDPIRRGVLSSKGELDWGGAAGTVYWWDPEEDLIVIGMIQLFQSPWRFRDDLSVAIYQSLSESYE